MSWSQIEPGQDYCHNWHLDCYSEHIKACLNGEIRTIVFNIPPGFTKSLTFGVAMPSYAWIKRPELRFIFASFDKKLVIRDARKSLELIRGDWYQDRWGQNFQIGSATGMTEEKEAEIRATSKKLPPVTEIRTTRGGSRVSTTVDGGITGQHANIHVYDDPVNPKDVNGARLENAIEQRALKFSTRWLAPGLNCEMVVMQRIHEKDLSGHILAEVTGAVHVCLPMRFDSRRRCVTAWFSDPRTEEGELLNAERYDEAKVKKLEEDLGPVNAKAQLDQDPMPVSGTIFKKEHFRYYKEADLKGVQLFDTCISVDCSFKDLESSDYVVMQVWARSQKQYYLRHQIRGRWDFPETLRRIRLLIEQFPTAYTRLIEDKANGSAIIQTLEKEMPGVLAVNPEGGKIARANAVSPMLEAHNVLFPEECPWVFSELEPELIKFPRGKNDDQVDTLSQALNWLRGNTNRLEEAMKEVRSQGFFGGVPILNRSEDEELF